MSYFNPPISFNIEPGDGTGCSIKDAQIRNQNGICSMLKCGNKIENNAISYLLSQKMCKTCEKKHKNKIEQYKKECLEDFDKRIYEYLAWIEESK